MLSARQTGLEREQFTAQSALGTRVSMQSEQSFHQSSVQMGVVHGFFFFLIKYNCGGEKHAGWFVLTFLSFGGGGNRLSRRV